MAHSSCVSIPRNDKLIPGSPFRRSMNESCSSAMSASISISCSLRPTSCRNLRSFMALPQGSIDSSVSLGSSGGRSSSVLPEILQSLAEPALVVDAESGTISACNRRCARLLESDVEDIVGKELKDVVMLVNDLEAGQTVECFFINGSGQCMNLLMGVTTHPFIDGLYICTLVLNEAAEEAGDVDLGDRQVGENEEAPIKEYIDDDTGQPFQVDLQKFLGAGGSGSVCEGTWADQRVAVKFVPCSSPEVLRSQYQEVQTLQGLEHANIIHFIGSAVLHEENTILVVLEFADHGSLQTMVESHRPVPAGQLRTYIVDALHALSYVHASGIVHRDVKPSNLLLCSGPNRVICKLTDFGSAIRKDLLKSMNPFLGTPVFMAPEQFEGQVGYYSDVWAIGLSTLFCVLRRAPYPADLVCNPLRLMFAIVDGLRPSIPIEGPQDLLDLARRTLLDSPLERPSIAEVLESLTGEVVPGESSEPITAPLTRDALADRLIQLDSGSWAPDRVRRGSNPSLNQIPRLKKASLAPSPATSRCLLS